LYILIKLQGSKCELNVLVLNGKVILWVSDFGVHLSMSISCKVIIQSFQKSERLEFSGVVALRACVIVFRRFER
jgi:hypothetical protein